MQDTHAARPLDDTHRRLQAVLNNASVSIFLMDDRQRCIYMNRAAEELTGWTLAEVMALDRPLHDIIHHTYPDGRPFPLHECAIDRAFPEHNQTRGEEIFVHRDGHFYPVAFTASPIRDAESHTIGTIIEVRDITEDKRAQERQRLLVNELNHRVKNTLATVQSIAWQTFKDSDAGAFERFSGRLSTLSRAHNVLTDSAWSGASLGLIAAQAADAIAPGRIAVSGPDVAVHPKAAVSLSMALHELGTNAVKHGALRDGAGQVALRWRAEPADDGALHLTLLWEERGGPEVTPPTRRGFGLRLIERQVAMEFGGRAEVEFLPEGLSCRIEMVLPRLPDALGLDPSAGASLHV
ncbi:sensor histidine kinase [Limimaricola pyoseonensis]|uniref:histidine kinase n=1 Tax=Limimaricola pyoseonensis TaxID=521013 RepID=A0A1G7G9M4_9RHOB|nr:HWE histidine kinase domain-containing protein [Limimaricola pyoseonensis]SDE84797.1 PAS domain S-box-containing protein [Limimaricola pyoseonensis]